MSPYSVIFSRGWYWTDTDGEEHDEPDGDNTHVVAEHVSSLELARFLLAQWVRLAAYHYGEGVLAITDARGRRVSSTHRAEPLPSAPAVA